MSRQSLAVNPSAAVIYGLTVDLRATLPIMPRPHGTASVSLGCKPGATDFFVKPLLVLGSHPRLQVHGQLDQLPGEAERRLVVVVVHPSACIHSDVEGLIDRRQERSGVRDRFASDFLSVHRQNASAALAEAGAIVLEVK